MGAHSPKLKAGHPSGVQAVREKEQLHEQWGLVFPSNLCLKNDVLFRLLGISYSMSSHYHLSSAETLVRYFCITHLIFFSTLYRISISKSFIPLRNEVISKIMGKMEREGGKGIDVQSRVGAQA